MIYNTRSTKYGIYVSGTLLEDLELYVYNINATHRHVCSHCPETFSPKETRLLSTLLGATNPRLMHLGPSHTTGFFEQGRVMTSHCPSAYSHLAQNKSLPSRVWSKPPCFDAEAAVTEIAADLGYPAYHLNALLAGAKTQTDAWRVVAGAGMGSVLHDQFSNSPGVYFFTNTGQPHLVKSLAAGFMCNQNSGIVDVKHSDALPCPAILLFVRDGSYRCATVRNKAHLRSLLAPILGLDQCSSNDECPICLEEMTETAEKHGSKCTSVQRFLCGHSLCSACADDELSMCPLCRCADEVPSPQLTIIRSGSAACLRGGVCA